MRHTALISILALLLALPAFAWDEAGHRQIADIAWLKLNEKAKAKIKIILKNGDPKFQPVSEKESDVREAFRQASVYADVIKFNRTTKYEPIIDEMNRLFFVTKEPNPSDNEDKLCKTWHYYDIPIRTKLGKIEPKESNALRAMDEARAQLKDLQRAERPDYRMQAWWLYWLLHVSGDLHQPLHCCSSFEYHAEGDDGGNKLMVRVPPSERNVRLHGYWDGGISKAIAEDRKAGFNPHVELVSMRWSEDKKLQPSRSAARHQNVKNWVRDGARMADREVYPGLKPDQPIPNGYEEKCIQISRKQAVLAGYRLANDLNAILGK